MTTAYDRIGGSVAVTRVCRRFYQLVLATEAGRHFVGIEMERLIEHQAQIIGALLGGPGEVSDAFIQSAHRRLNISPSDFALVAEALVESLSEARLADDDIKVIADAFVARADLVVGSLA